TGQSEAVTRSHIDKYHRRVLQAIVVNKLYLDLVQEVTSGPLPPFPISTLGHDDPDRPAKEALRTVTHNLRLLVDCLTYGDPVDESSGGVIDLRYFGVVLGGEFV